MLRRCLSVGSFVDLACLGVQGCRVANLLHIEYYQVVATVSG